MQSIKGNKLIEKYGVEYFQNASIFGALSPEIIKYLLYQGEIHSVEKGELIYDVGDKGNYFLIILSGSVSFCQYHQGEYVYIRDHKFGEELGFVAMIALHDRLGKTVASEDSIILKVSSILFSDLHRKHPADFGILLLNLSREMARTIRDIRNTLVSYKVAQGLSSEPTCCDTGDNQ